MKTFQYKLPDYDTPIDIHTKLWLFKIIGKSFIGITFNKKIYFRESYVHRLSDVKVRHEMIHVLQQKELTFPIFLLLYIGSWFLNILKYLLIPLKLIGVSIKIGKPYYNIIFEKEAYCNERDNLYLIYRNKYNYFKKKKR